MRPKLILAIFTFALIASLTACVTSHSGPGNAGQSLPPETNDPAFAAGFSGIDAAGARKLYLTKCARCHKFYDPATYEEADWNTWMRKMSKKAKLNPEQELLLSRYLAAFRGRNLKR